MTPEIGLLLALLAVTIALFVTEVLRTDVVAVLVMLALPWLGLIEPEEAFRGFGSAAVVSIMAVVVLGHGLDRTGATRRIAAPLQHMANGSPRRLLAGTLAAVSAFSAFIQNVGAAALFLPVGVRLGKAGPLRVSQLLLPLGYAAILGGTLTMIGSSPLIVLNDLVVAHGEVPFGLFDVTPIGLALLGGGVLFLVTLGPRMLPDRELSTPAESQADVLASWSFLDHLERAMVPEDCALIGATRREARLIDRFGVHVVAVRELGRTTLTPAADMRFAAGQRLVLLGRPEDIARLAEEVGLRLRDRAPVRSEGVGYAEVLVPPGSEHVGRTPHDIGMRRNLHVEPLAVLRAGEVHLREFMDRPLQAGDLLLVRGPQDRVRELATARRFVLLTSAEEAADAPGALRAALCFLTAIGLALAGVSLPVALLSGALGMILTGVLDMDDAYRAISWRTVFLLAGLIPLGVAMQSTGAAEFLAGGLFEVVGDASTPVVLLAVAALTSALTLFLSNVATTVVLVPLAIELGHLTATDPRGLALLVAVCAQNSFMLPTHQVNALLQGPGGYRNADYLRVGGVMTVLFLGIAVGGVWWMFG